MHPSLQPFADELQRLVPADTELIDVHTHLGRDEDGMELSLERLLAMMDDGGVRRACVFPLHDPDRHPAYRVPNDRVIDWAAASAGRLVPFCRVDPAQDPVAEIERCLARGARGVKLHPRAQGFDFAHSAMGDVFRVAHERAVPILIHAGRGMAPIATELCELALAAPATLILAHAGIADMGIFATRLADHPAAFFDTSVFSPLDLSELFARVAPERILFASDPPYGRPLPAAYAAARVARAVGLDDEGVRNVMGASAARVLAGEPPLPASRPARGRRLEMDGALARIFSLAMAALHAEMGGDATGSDWFLEMAEGACREPDPDGAAPTLARIAECLGTARANIAAGKRGPQTLVWIASMLAVTEAVDQEAHSNRSR